MKYTRLISALLLAVMLVACNTTKKLYEAQEYDQVIQRMAPDAVRGNVDAEDMNMLAESYHKANQADHERIQALKATGQPEVWPEIYQRYCSMKSRNEALSKMSQKDKRAMNYVKLDLDDDMMAARNKAENFLVAKTEQLLSTGAKEDAEQAAEYIKQLRRTNAENKNLLSLRKRQALCVADEVTLNWVEEVPLDKTVSEMALAFDEGELPFELVRTKKESAMITVRVHRVEVSPIRLDEVTFKETNGSGNVEVTDHTQNKSASLMGVIEYRDGDGHRIGSVPFETKSTFKNDYTTIKGDRQACSAETLSRLDSQAVPVPTDESLLIDAARQLNDLLAKELK